MCFSNDVEFTIPKHRDMSKGFDELVTLKTKNEWMNKNAIVNLFRTPRSYYDTESYSKLMKKYHLDKEIKIAQEDIICYKLYDKNYIIDKESYKIPVLVSMVQGISYQYKFPQTIEADEPIKVENISSHNECDNGIKKCVCIYFIDYGIHSFKAFPHGAYELSGYAIIKCIIPKGTRYAECNDEYVADRVILEGEVNVPIGI